MNSHRLRGSSARRCRTTPASVPLAVAAAWADVGGHRTGRACRHGRRRRPPHAGAARRARRDTPNRRSADRPQHDRRAVAARADHARLGSPARRPSSRRRADLRAAARPRPRRRGRRRQPRGDVALPAPPARRMARARDPRRQLGDRPNRPPWPASASPTRGRCCGGAFAPSLSPRCLRPTWCRYERRAQRQRPQDGRMRRVPDPKQLEQADRRARAAIEQAGGLLTHKEIAELAAISSRRRTCS